MPANSARPEGIVPPPGRRGRLLAAAGPEPAPVALQSQLAVRWDTYAPALLQALEVRARERGESLRRQLDERAAKEIRDSAAILTELRRTILAELNQPDVLQLSLFSDPEREQFERNIDSLLTYGFVALTAICTHEACTITGFRSSTYVCPCHGSTYNTSGAVLTGPATRALRMFPTQFAPTTNTLTIAV